ncbi:MAG: efflux RND transporter permease subunit, partial [candidate division Zixibacteria bacterium]|nr:efflux RND transporter permease subunit [candidate division Zixibacteria bacterium]
MGDRRLGEIRLLGTPLQSADAVNITKIVTHSAGHGSSPDLTPAGPRASAASQAPRLRWAEVPVDAVVVAEKILLRRQDGLSPADAAVSGTAMVARPVIASAVTTLLAFAPMLAIGGMASKIIWQIPAVVCLALGISLIESFLILPAHMSMVRSDARPRPKRAFVLRLEERYRWVLHTLLPRRGTVIAGVAVIFFALLFGIIPRM